jgi:hypothetical protein
MSQFTGETRRLLLLGTDPTLAELLDCADIHIELRRRNRLLIDFLMRPDRLRELIRLTTTVTGRSYHLKVLQLFDANLTELYSPPARNLPFLRDAFARFDEIGANESVVYGLGTLLRMLSKAAEEWGPEVNEVFELSESDENGGFFSAVVKYIDQGVVYNGIVDLIKIEHPELILLIWYVFRALAGGEYVIERRDWPRKVFLAPDIKLDFAFGRVHKQRATELLILFLQLPFGGDGDFRVLIGKWLGSLEYGGFTPELFEIGKLVGVNVELKQKVIGWVKEREDLTDEVVGAGVGYLGSIARALEWWEGAGVIAKLLLAGGLSQAGSLGAIEIARGFANLDDDVGLFVNAANQIVSVLWNTRVVPENDELLSATCVAIIDSLFVKNRIAKEDLLWDVAFLKAWSAVSDRYPVLQIDLDIWTTPVKDIADPELLRTLQKLEPPV